MLESLGHLQVPTSLETQIEKTCFCSQFFERGLESFDQIKFDDFISRVHLTNLEESLNVKVIEDLDFASISEDEFKSILRVWRNTNQMFIIFMDSNQLWSLEQVLQATSKMADVAINAAHQYSHLVFEKRFGKPSSKSDQVENVMSVLAMGKLGAFELNLSSDIDLIFVFPFSGNTVLEDQSSQKSISNEEFFTKVARKLIDCLHQVTKDGFVYRVDMRLRPWGEGGQLVLNQKSFFKYYVEHGRDWERFAMVKMRPVCGDVIFNEQILENIQHFVYRAYVDFQAIEALRDLKTLINKETMKIPNLNVKLGKGGIREVEFIVQSFQLVRGGSISTLQISNLYDVLELLKDNELLPLEAIKELKTAYDWLRKIEHGIQAYQDKQGQILPGSDELQVKIAKYIGLDNQQELLALLEKQMLIVGKHFENCIQKEQVDYPTNVEFEHYLNNLDCEKPNASIDLISQDNHVLLKAFVAQYQSKRITESVQERLMITLNFVLQALVKLDFESQADTLDVILKILESVLRRSSYLSLLNEHPYAIFEMVKLVRRSKWIGNQLIQRPFLFDELTDQTRLYHLPSESELSAQLRLMMLRIEQDDLEQQMETLRLFKHARVFRAAACEVMQTLDLPKVSDYLTQVANVVVQHSLQLSKDQMSEKYGSPQDLVDHQSDLSVIAYGKMGGFELNYHSDLDVVFMYDSSLNGKTDGEKSVENIVYYTKVAQRFMHLLNSKTYNGQLYEVDMRLRPSGNSGALVCSKAGFEKYQLNQAWTWEHQALIRTRSVAGMKNDEYLKLKSHILTTCKKDKLLEDVSSMREKMIKQLGSKAKAGEFKYDLKHDRGGLVDIEFMVQYWVLKFCEENVELCMSSDNLNLLNKISQLGIIKPEICEQLIDAYISLRANLHAQVLQDSSSVITDELCFEKIGNTVKNVEAIWDQFMVSCAP